MLLEVITSAIATKRITSSILLNLQQVAQTTMMLKVSD